MTKVVYLNEFDWMFDRTRAAGGDDVGPAPDAALDDVEVIRRFPSFSAFLDQLLKDLGAEEAAMRRAAELAEMEEELLLLEMQAGR